MRLWTGGLRPALALAVALTALPACKDDKTADDTGAAGDTDGSGDDGGTDSGNVDTSPPCETVLDETNPEEGDSWFYRDPFEVEFEGDGSSATITLMDTATKTAVAWDDSQTVWFNENTEVTLFPATPLAANTEYLFSVDICDVTTEVTFTTDQYGEPVKGGANSLVDRTWVIKLAEVTYTEPAGLGFILKGTLTVPILVGVTEVGKDFIDLLGAEGVLHRDNYYYQYTGFDTWDFSGAAWQDPFFSLDADSVDLNYDDITIPIYNFHLEGTFAPDGSAIAGGKLWGLGDTREMGQYVSGTSADEELVCDLLEVSGVYCEACPSDGKELCIYLKAEEIFGEEEEGLTLVEVNSDPDTGSTD